MLRLMVLLEVVTAVLALPCHIVVALARARLALLLVVQLLTHGLMLLLVHLLPLLLQKERGLLFRCLRHGVVRGCGRGRLAKLLNLLQLSSLMPRSN